MTLKLGTFTWSKQHITSASVDTVYEKVQHERNDTLLRQLLMEAKTLDSGEVRVPLFTEAMIKENKGVNKLTGDADFKRSVSLVDRMGAILEQEVMQKIQFNAGNFGEVDHASIVISKENFEKLKQKLSIEDVKMLEQDQEPESKLSYSFN